MKGFKIDGVFYPEPDNVRVREMAEAEKALGMNADEVGVGGRLAITLYIVLRRKDPERSPGLVADEALNADMTHMEEVEEEDSPLASTPDEPSSGPESPRTSGHPPLEALG